MISKTGDNADDSMSWKDNAEPGVSQSQKPFPQTENYWLIWWNRTTKWIWICSFTMFSFSEPITRSRVLQEQCQYHHEKSLQMFQPSNTKCSRIEDGFNYMRKSLYHSPRMPFWPGWKTLQCMFSRCVTWGTLRWDTQIYLRDEKSFPKMKSKLQPTVQQNMRIFIGRV